MCFVHFSLSLGFACVFVCVCVCVFMHDFNASVKPPTAPIRQQEWQIKPADSVQVAAADGEEITL